MRAALLLLSMAFVAPGGGIDAPDESTLDFSSARMPAGFSLRGASWKVQEGELRGAGDGALEFAGPITGDVTLSFTGWTAEKTNFEVKLTDAATGADCYTFAFLGRYHSVLDGVKFAILRENAFVKTDPKMWIYPGRKFKFEVRIAKGQMQMSLDDELGPLFVDPAPLKPAKGMKLSILASTEGTKDAVRLDDVKLALAAPK